MARQKERRRRQGHRWKFHLIIPSHRGGSAQKEPQKKVGGGASLLGKGASWPPASRRPTRRRARPRTGQRRRALVSRGRRAAERRWGGGGGRVVAGRWKLSGRAARGQWKAGEGTVAGRKQGRQRCVSSVFSSVRPAGRVRSKPCLQTAGPARAPPCRSRRRRASRQPGGKGGTKEMVNPAYPTLACRLFGAGHAAVGHALPSRPPLPPFPSRTASEGDERQCF